MLKVSFSVDRGGVWVFVCVVWCVCVCARGVCVCACECVVCVFVALVSGCWRCSGSGWLAGSSGARASWFAVSGCGAARLVPRGGCHYAWVPSHEDQFSLVCQSILLIFVSVLTCCRCGRVALLTGARRDKIFAAGSPLLFEPHPPKTTGLSAEC